MKNLTIAPAFFKTVVFAFSLSVLTVFTGCSSKNDENSSSTSEPCSTTTATESVLEKTVTPQNMDRNEPNKERRPMTDRQTILADSTPAIRDIMTELSYIGTPTERKVELLESLNIAGMEQDPAIIDVVKKALEDPNVEVCQAAIALLQGADTPDALPAIEQALKNPDEQIRRDAIDILADIEDPHVSDLLIEAIKDASEDIRDAALNVARMQNSDRQHTILQQGITSEFPDVKDSTISMLQDEGTSNSVGILIDGLSDANPEFREKISDILDTLIEKKFDTPEQAKEWWEANKANYNDDLTPKENN